MKITKIPNGYFIYLEGNETEYKQWINLNLIEEIEEHPDKINIRFNNNPTQLCLRGKKAKALKQGIKELMERQTQ
jgi:hypothetical protein